MAGRRESNFAMAPFSFVVCGSNYGRCYLAALDRLSAECRLAALLASGSRRSVQLARRRGVPLARRVEELPAAIDVACFALPSTANPAALELLERGVSIICEHPRKETFLRSALRLADTAGQHFHLNAHFSMLPAPQAFAQASRQFHEQFEARWMRLRCSDRLLYSGLDLLRSSLGLSRFEFSTPRFHAGFAFLEGAVEGLPTQLEVQVAGSGPQPLADGSPEYLADLRLECGFSEGTLTLTALAGPVIWNWNYHRFNDLPNPLGEEIHGACGGRQMARCREEANVHCIQEMVACIQGVESPPRQRPRHLLEVSRCWQAVGSLLAEGDRPPEVDPP